MIGVSETERRDLLEDVLASVRRPLPGVRANCTAASDVHCCRATFTTSLLHAPGVYACVPRSLHVPSWYRLGRAVPTPTSRPSTGAVPRCMLHSRVTQPPWTRCGRAGATCGSASSGSFRIRRCSHWRTPPPSTARWTCCATCESTCRRAERGARSHTLWGRLPLAVPHLPCHPPWLACHSSLRGDRALPPQILLPRSRRRWLQPTAHPARVLV